MLKTVIGIQLSLCGLAAADSLVLKNGSRLEGDLTRTADGWIVTAADGAVTRVSTDAVAKVQLTGGDDASAMSKLASLKRAVEALDSIDEIISRYERFIASNASSAAAQEAERELAVWRDRKDQQLVRVGAKWVSPEEKRQMLAALQPRINEVRQFVAAGQLADGAALVGEVLKLQPDEVAALYLQGLIQFLQDQLPPARKTFEAVNAQIAGHAPTLNNLAVINFRQKQYGVALNYFDQALAAAPVDQTILNNIAEALNAMREEEKHLPIAEKLARRFEQQDAVLAARLQKQDLYRWGATWVSRAQRDKLEAAEKDAERKVAQYKTDFDAAGLQIGLLENQISESQRTLKRIEQESYVIDPTNGRAYRRAYPSYYFDEQRRLQQLQNDRVQQVARQQALREQANRVKEDLPVPRYTGVMKPIGEEGTPLDSAAAEMNPATQPAK